MAIRGCSLSQVQSFIAEVDKFRGRLKSDDKYLDRVLYQKEEYHEIKKFFGEFVKFLRYQVSVDVKSLYRVRKDIDNDQPFVTRKELIYPTPNIEHEERMNNTAFRVLYTSFHEFTAMAESRLDACYINTCFQLTRFTTDEPIKVYKLGMFSDLYTNTPRDSEFVRESLNSLLGKSGHDAAQGYSALECAMSEVLYDVSDKYHLLSSILADAIFSENSDVDAIMYPTMQNRYGMNLAIKQEYADTMKIAYTCLNKLTDVYDNGFYRYMTIKECLDTSKQEQLFFSNVDNSSSSHTWR